MPPAAPSTGLSITNPLILYRALLATKRIDPDPAQHRLAIHLQKLYDRLKDYEPIVQYGFRLQQISRQLGGTPAQPAPRLGDDIAPPPTGGILARAFQKKAEKEGLALTRVVTSQEAAVNLDSPKGLMLHGEVGTGKSMLIDLFADCLPNRKKKRWHYTTFMLHVLHQLEALRRSRQLIIPSSLGQEDDYSLLWLARDLISTSPILFLDEFQLPDRAAAKIMTNLMTCFFHLGGVLIATSNRMPEELAKAAGMDFAQPPPSRLDSLGWSFGLVKKGKQPNPGKRSEFAAFLDVLRARCEVWEMEGASDYRRKEAKAGARQAQGLAKEESGEEMSGLEATSLGNMGLGWEQSLPTSKTPEDPTTTPAPLPKNYYIKPLPTDPPEAHALYTTNLALLISRATLTPPTTRTPWTPSTIRVYGRSVLILRQHAGATMWTFTELCMHPFGPADYITLASTYHTLILTDVPILSNLQKNEARRLITLLDALYEARCKLIVTADAGPDDIFFPEQVASPASKGTGNDAKGGETVDQDAVYPETISEIYQDATAPFRPNISSYSSATTPEPDIAGPEEADATHARFAGMFASSTPSYSQGVHPDLPPVDQLEDTPPNTLPRGLDTGDDIAVLAGPQNRSGRGVTGGRGSLDFQKANAFTGEDEKFAYKRARSRLWEMCGGRWWDRGVAPLLNGTEKEGGMKPEGVEGVMQGVESWWRPVSADVRRWEQSISSSPASSSPSSSPPPSTVPTSPTSSSATTDNNNTSIFRDGASPFRTSAAPPPKFSFQHFWGVVRWGKGAGRWGRGPAAIPHSGRKEGEKGEGEGGEKGEGEAEGNEEYVKRRYQWRKKGDDDDVGGSN